MNVDEIKNHFEIAMSCEFDTQRVHDPKEHIRICCELSDDCNIFIGKTYDMIDLSCIDPLERKTTGKTGLFTPQHKGIAGEYLKVKGGHTWNTQE